MEFSKKLLIVDYAVLGVLFICSIFIPSVDFPTIICAWIGQLAISSGMYYWKAKNENRTKVPIKVLESLPSEMRDQLDMTQIIASIIQAD